MANFSDVWKLALERLATFPGIAFIFKPRGWVETSVVHFEPSKKVTMPVSRLAFTYPLLSPWTSIGRRQQAWQVMTRNATRLVMTWTERFRIPTSEQRWFFCLWVLQKSWDCWEAIGKLTTWLQSVFAPQFRAYKIIVGDVSVCPSPLILVDAMTLPKGSPSLEILLSSMALFTAWTGCTLNISKVLTREIHEITWDIDHCFADFALGFWWRHFRQTLCKEQDLDTSGPLVCATSYHGYIAASWQTCDTCAVSCLRSLVRHVQTFFEVSRFSQQSWTQRSNSYFKQVRFQRDVFLSSRKVLENWKTTFVLEALLLFASRHVTKDRILAFEH